MPSATATYIEIAGLAFPDKVGDPNLTFVITYRKAERPHEGSLAEGGTVEVKHKGTIFQCHLHSSLVVRTSRACGPRGYEVAVRDGHLVLSHVPYLTPAGAVAYGVLVSGAHAQRGCHDHAERPRRVLRHRREQPSTRPRGRSPEPDQCPEPTGGHPRAHSLNFSFSNKPDAGFPNYYEKMTHYVNLLAGHAQAKDPTATATTFFVPNDEEDDSVFLYSDSASTRAGIAAITARLKLSKIAIVGLGGTGSYILDFVAKTPSQGDPSLRWRPLPPAQRLPWAPGAASIADLQALSFKVDYHAARYSVMRRGVVPHPYFITPTRTWTSWTAWTSSSSRRREARPSA